MIFNNDMILNVDPQLSQWDVNRIVKVSDTDATHIHFANPGDSKAPIIEVVNGEAKIPNYLLQTGKPVVAYAVLDGVTILSNTFPVRKRERPENYIYDEDQRNYIYELIANAEASASEAQDAADRANEAADRVSGHIDDKENPHGVTCEQIDAVSVDELAERVDAILGSNGVTEHLLDKENPHGVTCEQIGAGTREEMDTMQGHLLSLQDEVNGHKENAANPHKVTCEQIGAAPAGYGLGESASFADNWNKGYVNAFARSNSNSPDGKMWYGLICRDATNAATTTEIAFSTEAGNLVSEVRRSRNAAGTWGSWEYVNPPMLEGVEYRTTERWNGMPVYTKLVRADSAKHGAFVDTPGYIIRADGFLSDDEINGLPIFCLPYGQAAWLEIDSMIGITLCFANGYNDIGGEYFFVQIWYLK